MKRLAALLLTLLLCVGAHARMGALSTNVVVTPTLIQHVASSANPAGIGISGNAFKIPIPNAIGAGNCLVLAMSYPHGSGAVITDNNGNTWGGSAALADAGAGGYIAVIFVLPNANAGATMITVTFASAIIPFQYTLSEFNNLATSSVVNGASAVNSDAGASISAGSFTPGNNDANGGNIIWSYFAPDGGASQNPSSWVAGSGMTLLDGDIAWNTNQGFPHASQWQIQTTSAAVNPTITATGDTNTFNAVAVALKVASAGSAKPAGIHLDRLAHMTSNVPPTSSWTLQFPVTGNLRVLSANEPSPVINITGVTDSESGSWSKINPSTDEPQIWYRANTSANPNLTVTLSISGTPATASIRFYDISGAAASPLGATAGSAGTAVGGTTSISNFPSITPQSSTSLIISRGSLGQGPGLTVSAPAGAVFTLTTYAAELDTDLMENADLEAIYYNSSTAQKNFGWTFTNNPSNTASAVAAEFKAP